MTNQKENEQDKTYPLKYPTTQVIGLYCGGQSFFLLSMHRVNIGAQQRKPSIDHFLKVEKETITGIQKGEI